jgi:hypothetical protein
MKTIQLDRPQYRMLRMLVDNLASEAGRDAEAAYQRHLVNPSPETALALRHQNEIYCALLGVADGYSAALDDYWGEPAIQLHAHLVRAVRARLASEIAEGDDYIANAVNQEMADAQRATQDREMAFACYIDDALAD